LEILAEIIELLASIQLMLVISLLCIAYGIKIYLHYLTRDTANKQQGLDVLCNTSITTQQPITLAHLKPYRKAQALLLKTIEQFDTHHPTGYWQTLRVLLIEQLILPNAVRFAASRDWSKRYVACQSFALAMTPEHETIILALLNDPVVIIALNAALIAVSYDSQALINAVIDSGAKNRHIQQSLYAQLMLNTHPRFTELVTHRLQHETDPYIKAFCYRMLSQKIVPHHPLALAFTDANTGLIELRIAAMVYLQAHSNGQVEQLLSALLSDIHWEVRAKAAKLLGKIGKPAIAPQIARCLHDDIWWVRVCAAEALGMLGPTGLALLTKQSLSNDQFADDQAKTMTIQLREHDD
jgi:hypothetical protein